MRWKAGASIQAEGHMLLPETDRRPPVHPLGTGQERWGLWEFPSGSFRFF